MTDTRLDESILALLTKPIWADKLNIALALFPDPSRADLRKVASRLQALRQKGKIRFYCGEWRLV